MRWIGAFHGSHEPQIQCEYSLARVDSGSSSGSCSTMMVLRRGPVPLSSSATTSTIGMQSSINRTLSPAPRSGLGTFSPESPSTTSGMSARAVSMRRTSLCRLCGMNGRKRLFFDCLTGP